MSEIKVINGGIYSDSRGKISFVNDFDLKEIRRFYSIIHTDTKIIRAWNGHKFEKKWFYCIKGGFKLSLVKIDNWTNPSENLIQETFTLSENESKVIYVPGGYANGMKALIPNSIMLVFSDKTLEQATEDNWKFDVNLWSNW